MLHGQSKRAAMRAFTQLAANDIKVTPLPCRSKRSITHIINIIMTAINKNYTHDTPLDHEIRHL